MKTKAGSLFPKKMKKSVQRFLTEESWRITKKDALWISVAWTLAAWIESAAAGHWNVYTSTTVPAAADPYPSDGEVPANNSRTNEWTIMNDATCNHSSGIVNGHYSNVPSVNILSEQIEYTKSHASHSSHGSGGWC